MLLALVFPKVGRYVEWVEDNKTFARSSNEFKQFKQFASSTHFGSVTS